MAQNDSSSSSFSSHPSDPDSASARRNARIQLEAFASQVVPRRSSGSSEQRGSILSGKAGYHDAIDRPAVAARAFAHTTPGGMARGSAGDHESSLSSLAGDTAAVHTTPGPDSNTSSAVRDLPPPSIIASSPSRTITSISSIAKRMLQSPATDSQPSISHPQRRNRTRSHANPDNSIDSRDPISSAAGQPVSPIPAPSLPATPSKSGLGPARVLLVTESPVQASRASRQERRAVMVNGAGLSDGDEDATVPGTSSGGDAEDHEEEDEDEEEDGDDEDPAVRSVRTSRATTSIDSSLVAGVREQSDDKQRPRPKDRSDRPYILVQASAEDPNDDEFPAPALAPPITLARSPTPRCLPPPNKGSSQTRPANARRSSALSERDTIIETDDTDHRESDSMLPESERKRIAIRKAQKSMQGEFQQIAAGVDSGARAGGQGDKSIGAEEEAVQEAVHGAVVGTRQTKRRCENSLRGPRSDTGPLNDATHVDDTDTGPTATGVDVILDEDTSITRFRPDPCHTSSTFGPPDAAPTPFAAFPVETGANRGETPDVDERGNVDSVSKHDLPHVLIINTAVSHAQQSSEPLSAGSSRLAALPARRKLGKTLIAVVREPEREFSPDMQTPPDGHCAPLDERDQEAEPEATFTEVADVDSPIARKQPMEGQGGSDFDMEEGIGRPDASEPDTAPPAARPVANERGRRRRVTSRAHEASNDEAAAIPQSLPAKTPPRSNQKVYGKGRLGSGGRVRKPTQRVMAQSSSLSGSSSSEPEDEDDSTWRPNAGMRSAGNQRRDLSDQQKISPAEPAQKVGARPVIVPVRSESPAATGHKRGSKRPTVSAPTDPAGRKRRKISASADDEADPLNTIDQPNDDQTSRVRHETVANEGPAIGTRVFAYWSAEQFYYPGVIFAVDKTASICFDDTTTAKAPLDKLFYCRLKVGDIVSRTDMGKGNGDPQWMVTKLPPRSFDLDKTHVISLKRIDEPRQTCKIAVKDLRIKKKAAKQMNDRKCPPGAVDASGSRSASTGAVSMTGTAVSSALAPSPTPDMRPVPKGRAPRNKPGVVMKTNVTSPRKKPIGTALRGYGFILSNMDSTVLSLSARKDRIRRQGGVVEEDIWNYYRKPDDYANGHHGFRLKDKYGDLRGLFVLLQSGSPVMTPKVMMALAIGIPLLSYQFVADAVVPDIPWQSYLVAAGRSEYLGNHVSQIISPGWGNGPDALLESLDRTSARRPFWDCDVLVITGVDVHEIVPFCCSIMGAKSVITLDTLAGVNDLDDYDFVIVGIDQEDDLPDALRNNPKIVNVEYLKQCLIVGRALPKRCYQKSNNLAR